MSPAELWINRWFEGANASESETAPCCPLISKVALRRHKRGVMHIAFLTGTPFSQLRHEIEAALTARAGDAFVRSTSRVDK